MVIILCQSINAQDIEPRRWASLPINTNFIASGYAYSFGEVKFDPLLEATDVKVKANSLLVTYIKPFKFGDKVARLDVRLPYNFMVYKGKLSGEPTSVNRNGFGDLRIRLSMNLLGPPAGNIKALKKYYVDNPINTTFGASIAFTLPTGQYFDEKLINIGENRLTIRPQLGVVHSSRSWSYELTGSMFIFTNNNNFFGGKTKRQNPIFALQAHIIKQFNPKIWASFSVSCGMGGVSVVNNISNSDFRTNLLSAGSFGFKLTQFQSLKCVYLNSSTLKDIGSNTHSLIVGWSHIFL